MNFLKNLFKSASNKNTFPEQKHKEQTKDQSIDIPPQILAQLFEKTAQLISKSKAPISSEQKLQLYGLYKQAKLGDCLQAQPAMLNFIEKSKWSAWVSNKGLSKMDAMKHYICLSNKLDASISTKISQQLESGQGLLEQKKETWVGGIKMAEEKDYSQNYSHPYFKRIAHNEAISQEEITLELLMTVNNAPAVYPLHFAIDRERLDTIRQFLKYLTVEEIKQMKDEDGSGIMEYAEASQNEQIIQLIMEKKGK